jgi:hypothetical protein
MKKIDFSSHLNKVWMLAMIAFMAACSQIEAPEPDVINKVSKEELSAFKLNPYGNGMENARAPLAGKGTASVPVSAGEITPYIITGTSGGGNRTCDEVATAYGIGSFGNSFEQINTPFTNNTATFGAITATTDGTFVSWSIEVPDGYCVKYLAAVVKGSNDANVYFYEGDVRSDSGLASPPAGSGPASLSNLRFCYTLEEKPEAPIVKGDEACDEEGSVLRATLDGSIPEGYTLQWYEKNGSGEFVPVEDPKLDEVGSKTYYAAFVNGCTSNMSEGAVLTINPLPAAPISGGDLVGDCDDVLTATIKDVPDGITIVWYDKDGNIVEDPSLSYDESIGGDQTVTFYAEAVDDETKCASERTAVMLTLKECEEPCYDFVWKGETAWAAGARYVRQGNWATYTAYSGSAKSVTLFAGQTMNAGTAAFSAVSGGMVTITITLKEGWRLKAGNEAVKIQGYTSAPSGNPSPGLFTTYKGKSVTITVPQRAFYGIHLDVEWQTKEQIEVECPEGE